MRLPHSPDASTFPGFKLMSFVYIICFLGKIKLHYFNRNISSHLAFCLHVKLLHCNEIHSCHRDHTIHIEMMHSWGNVPAPAQFYMGLTSAEGQRLASVSIKQ